MRNLTSSALAKIAQQKGAEPFIVISVQWVINGPFVWYGDKEKTGIKGAILDISNLDDVIAISNNSSSASITVKLDDTDGTIKQILNTNDVHLRRVRVYQWFEGLSNADLILLFDGKINSPVSWDAGDLSVSFDVLSTLESIDIGFTPDEGDSFGWIQQKFYDSAWPLGFGTVLLQPGLKVYEIPSGTTTKPISMPDTCNSNSSNQQGYTQSLNSLNVALMNIEEQLEARLAEGALRLTSYQRDNPEKLGTEEYANFVRGYNNTNSQLLADARNRFDQTQNDWYAQNPIIVGPPQSDKSAEIDYGINLGHVINGRYFPQGQQVTIQVNDAILTGSFSGDNFNTRTAVNPNGQCSGFVQDGYNYEYIDSVSEISYQQYDKNNNMTGTVRQRTWQLSSAPNVSQAMNSQDSTYWFADGGSTVDLIQGGKNVFIVNLIQSTVLGVYGYYGVNGIRTLTKVPGNLYRVVYRQISTNYVVTTIEMDRNLSSVEGWNSDDIFVTYQSSVGPNPVDIITWLIQTYSDFAIDSSTFNYVRNKLNPFPANFAYHDQRSLINAVQEIAWQSRCRIWLNDGKFFMQYLAEMPSPVDTITLDDVIFPNLSLEHTPTEDLRTKLNASWRHDGEQADDNKMVARYNIAKYGVLEEDYDFYIFNQPELVQLSLTFWTIRYGNTWKKAKFKVPLTKLKVETFDCIEVTIPDLCTGTVRCLVENASYSSADKSIDIEIWMPILAGQMTSYNFAWPANVDINAYWPNIAETYAGDNKQVSNGASFGLGLPQFIQPTVNGVNGRRRRRISDSSVNSAPAVAIVDPVQVNRLGSDPRAKSGKTRPPIIVTTPPFNHNLNQDKGLKANYPDPKLVQIDISQTPVIDSSHEDRKPGLLNNILRLTDDQRVALWNNALMVDEALSNHKQINFQFDEEDELYRPTGSFLLDDEDEQEVDDLPPPPPKDD